MAPSAITEDYYGILSVRPNATAESIRCSYRQLALKLHPDRNKRLDAKAAFQRLQQAYETLSDESARRAYDLLYPSITGKSHKAQDAQRSSRPQASSSSQSARPAFDHEAQIADIEKSKQARALRWSTRKVMLEAAVSEVQRSKRRIEQEIANLASIAAAELAEEAAKNSWAAWLMSPLYKKVEESEEEKARKERRRQERRIERDLKERKLSSFEVDLKTKQSALNLAQAEIRAADADDDDQIRIFKARIQLREKIVRLETERIEREKQAKVWKEEREAEARAEAESWAQEMAKRQAAARARQEAADRQKEKQAADQIRQHVVQQARRTTCAHYGWWDKVHGRIACPECSEVWTYLLECPQCQKKACPKCQGAIRDRRHGRPTRTNQRVPPRVRTPSPHYHYGYGDWYD